MLSQASLYFLYTGMVVKKIDKCQRYIQCHQTKVNKKNENRTEVQAAKAEVQKAGRNCKKTLAKAMRQWMTRDLEAGDLNVSNQG